METRQYVVGDVITMRLMRREKGALVAMPSCQWVKVEEPVRFGGEKQTRHLFMEMTLNCVKLFNRTVVWRRREYNRTISTLQLSFLYVNDFSKCLCCPDACLSPYSKLLLASPAQALSLVTEEKAVLQAQLSQDVDTHGCFIQSALCLLQVTKARSKRTQEFFK